MGLHGVPLHFSSNEIHRLSLTGKGSLLGTSEATIETEIQQRNLNSLELYTM